MKNKGFVLVVILFLVLFLGAIGLNTVRVFRSSIIESVEVSRSTQTLGIAQAGMNWVLKEFSKSNDWVALASSLNASSQPFAGGSFTLHIPSASATTALVIVSANITGGMGLPNLRTMELTLSKGAGGQSGGGGSGIAVAGSPYALYVADNQAITMRNGASIQGNFYNGSNVKVNSDCSVSSGKIYVPYNKKATGAGSFIYENVDQFATNVPALNSSFYDNLVSQYDAALQSLPTNTIYLSGTVDLSAAPYNKLLSCGTLRLNGNCTIIGEGVIAAKTQILADNYSLTVSPNAGKNIALLSGGSIDLRGSNSNQKIYIERSTIYATGDQSINFSYNYVTINNTLIIGNDTKLDINRGAQLIDCTAFLKGSSEEVFSLTSASGYPVSLFRGQVIVVDHGLGSITGISSKRSQFEGLYYDNSLSSDGVILSYADIRGSIITNRVSGLAGSNRLEYTSIIFDASAFPKSTPDELLSIVGLNDYKVSYLWRGD